MNNGDLAILGFMLFGLLICLNQHYAPILKKKYGKYFDDE